MSANEMKGQQTPQETKQTAERLKVGEHEVDVSIDGDEVKISTPQGLEGDALDKFKQDAEKAVSALAFANKKNLESNKLLESIEEREKALKEKEEMLKRLEQQASQPKVEDDETEEKDFSGIKDANELYKRLKKDLESGITQKAINEAQMTVLKQRILAEGNDPKEVESFARGYLGAPLNSNIYDIWKRIKTPPIQSNLADLQTKKVTFIPSSESVKNENLNPVEEILKESVTDANQL